MRHNLPKLFLKKTRTLWSRRRVLLIIFLFAAVGAEAALFVSTNQRTVFDGGQKVPKDLTLSEYAEGVLKSCVSRVPVQRRLACYDALIPKLMDTLSMEDSFEVARIVTDKDPHYLHCHVLAHNLASREVEKDPGKWMDVVARCPALACNNGCPHGALMARFQNKVESLADQQIEQIKPDLRRVCRKRDQWNPSVIEESMCYHALGHLHMYMTNADVAKAIEICRDVGKQEVGVDHVETCIEGVFMEIFQPLDPEDWALVGEIRPENKEEVDALCGRYTGVEFHACHRESWPIFYPGMLKSEGFKELCSYTPEKPWQIRCMSALMNKIAVYYLIERDQMENLKNFCVGLGEGFKGLCFAHAVRRLIQVDARTVDKAIKVCEVAKEAGAQRDCEEMLAFYPRLNFNKGSKQYADYCNALPERLRERCSSNFEPKFSWSEDEENK